jgi:hypothetical protein
MSVAQVLTEARKLIAQGWTQGKIKSGMLVHFRRN